MFGTQVSLGSGFIGSIRESKSGCKKVKSTCKTKPRKAKKTLHTSMVKAEAVIRPSQTLAVIKPKYR